MVALASANRQLPKINSPLPNVSLTLQQRKAEQALRGLMGFHRAQAAG